MVEPVRAASTADLPPGTSMGVELDGQAICLVSTEDGEIYALQDNCSHQDFPLSAGAVEAGQIECAWHGARFDVASGRALSLPAIRPVKTYEVTVEGDDVLVTLE